MTFHRSARRCASCRSPVPPYSGLVEQKAVFDTLSATADSLQRELTAGTVKSTEIVDEYHRSINRYNGYLNAVCELAPDAMARASQMDQLRSEGSVLGPLHGIPVLIKVCLHVLF